MAGRGMSGAADHFSPVAGAYASRRPGYPDSVADVLADLAPSDDVAWDAGCGSGQLSVVLARRFGRVVATDVSAEQLAHAAPHPRVEYRRSPAERSGLPSNSVDLSTAAQAAHWFDLDAYYAEVRRVGRPGSIVALLTYGGVTVGEEVDPVIRRFHHEVLGPHWPPERRHVESGYRTLPFPFEEIAGEEIAGEEIAGGRAAPEVGRLELRARWTVDELVGYVGTWSAVSALRRAGEGAAFDAFSSEVAEAWGGRRSDGRESRGARTSEGQESRGARMSDGRESRGTGAARDVRWPLSLRVGRV